MTNDLFALGYGFYKKEGIVQIYCRYSSSTRDGQLLRLATSSQPVLLLTLGVTLQRLISHAVISSYGDPSFLTG